MDLALSGVAPIADERAGAARSTSSTGSTASTSATSTSNKDRTATAETTARETSAGIGRPALSGQGLGALCAGLESARVQSTGAELDEVGGLGLQSAAQAAVHQKRFVCAAGVHLGSNGCLG